MPKINVYVPQAMRNQLRAADPPIPISEICQAALQKELEGRGMASDAPPPKARVRKLLREALRVVDDMGEDDDA